MSIQALIRLGVFEYFPSEGTTVQDLARNVNLDENLVRRLISHAATYHVFFQAKHDFFIHTAASRVLSENAGMRAWMLIGLEEIMPGTFKASCFLSFLSSFYVNCAPLKPSVLTERTDPRRDH